MITAITKIRNESLILEDTLRHWLQHCESVLLYDDDSTDDSVEIAESFDRVRVIRGTPWSPNRTAEETRIRGLLLGQAIDSRGVFYGLVTRCINHDPTKHPTHSRETQWQRLMTQNWPLYRRY